MDSQPQLRLTGPRLAVLDRCGRPRISAGTMATMRSLAHSRLHELAR